MESLSSFIARIRGGEFTDPEHRIAMALETLGEPTSRETGLCRTHLEEAAMLTHGGYIAQAVIALFLAERWASKAGW